MIPDETLMRSALECAAHSPALPFGAVIACLESGAILSRGWNRSVENPTWHGEIDAINQLAARGWPDHLLALYSTAEPCPMCQAAILWAGIERVRFGTSIETLERLGWKQIGIRAAEVVSRTPFQACDVQGGLLEAECDQLFERAIGINPRS